MGMPSKGAWSIICLQKMIYLFLSPSPAFWIFQNLRFPTPGTTVPVSLGLFRVFPGGWRLSLPPPFRSRAEARACAGSGKAVRARREAGEEGR